MLPSQRKLHYRLPVPACVTGWLCVFLLFLSSCTDSGIEPLAEHVPTMKGFSYTSFAANGFEEGRNSGALVDLHRQTACDYVALNVFEFQATTTSTEITATTGTSSESDLRLAVADARALGLKIFLKPNLDLQSGEWRANIKPDAAGKWFTAYSAMILRYARLAEELHIELFSVGCELVAATQAEYTAQWRSMITEVRQVYNGKLTYCANWSGNSALGLHTPEYESIAFWDALDYISIDAYYPLTDSPSAPTPSYTSAIATIRTHTSRIGNVVARLQKKVIFSECGIQSVRGALAEPYNFQRGNAANALADNELQDFYYRVFIDAAGKQPWCEGIFWWNWESQLSSTEKTNYTVRNKPAAARVKAWYGGLV